MSQILYFPNIPYSVYMGLTYDCNCKCTHCYARDRINYYRPKLDYVDYINLLEKLYSMGTLSVTYSHGETLLYPKYKEIFKYANDLGLRQVLISNGLLIDKNIIQGLEECGIDVILLSLDSLNEAEHDRNRGRHGCFEKLQNSIDLLQKSNIKSRGLAVTIAQRNQKELEDFIIFGIEKEFEFISLLTERNGNALSESERKDFRLLISKYRKDIDIITHDYRLLEYIDDIQFVNKKDKSVFIADNKCHIGNQLSIDVYGDIRICNFIDEVFGNCKVDKIEDILKKDVLSGIKCKCKI